MSTLKSRLDVVEQKISDAALSAGRSRDDITLIVVSKNNPAQLVLDLAELGVTNFGENRDQEAKPKAAEVALAGKTVTWHFVGQLQSNKAKSALSYSSVLHSLDRPSLLDAVGKAVADRAEPLDVFIQLNLTEDENRGGIQTQTVLSFAEQVLQTPNLRLLGLMGVAGLDVDPRVDFDRIRRSSEQLMQIAPDAKCISAGMSEDFELAIASGATHVRIGTAITGKRPY